MCIIVAIFLLDYIAVVRLISVIVFDSSLPAPSQMSLGILRLTINDTSARRQPLPQPPPPTTSVDNAAHLEHEEDTAQLNTTHVCMPQTPQMLPTLTIRMPQLPTVISAGVHHVTETPPYVSSVYQPPNIVTNQVGAQPCVNWCHVIDPHPQPLSSSPIWHHPAPSVQICPHPFKPHPHPSTPSMLIDAHPCPPALSSVTIHTHLSVPSILRPSIHFTPIHVQTRLSAVHPCLSMTHPLPPRCIHAPLLPIHAPLHPIHAHFHPCPSAAH